MSYLSQCPIYHLVLTTTLSYVPPCHIYHLVISTTLPTYHHVISIPMSYLSPCPIYHNVLSTTLSELPLYPIYHPGPSISLVYQPDPSPCSIRLAYLSDPLTGSAHNKPDLPIRLVYTSCGPPDI